MNVRSVPSVALTRVPAVSPSACADGRARHRLPWCRSPDALRQALEHQAAHAPLRLGEALLVLGVIDQTQLEQALARQKIQTAWRLGELLCQAGGLGPLDLQWALWFQLAYPFVDLDAFAIDPAAVRLVPAALALRMGVVPVLCWHGHLVVAVADPLQSNTLGELEFTLQCKVLPVVALPADWPAAIAKVYREGVGAYSQSTSGALQAQEPRWDVAEAPAWLLVSELQDLAETPVSVPEQSDNTLVRLVNSMINEAHQQQASDIHLEPYPGREKALIRFRIDGRLVPYLELPAHFAQAMVARLKVMAGLDIAERRKPQDGKIDFARYGGRSLELRVAVIPTAHGLEDVVLRLLVGAQWRSLASLNLFPDTQQSLSEAAQRPHGLLLCVGPTGSGNTTLLHALLHQLNRPECKIWTAEDPVEITQPGLRQIQVHARIGWTFAHALRALLRADPDVIMVGEVRDRETAVMAVEAALTGHLVLSTLHTNSAIETVTRLHDLGVETFAFADALLGILAQRLVRRWCAACVVSQPLEPASVQAWHAAYVQGLPLAHPWHDRERWMQAMAQRHGPLRQHQAGGCAACAHTGYKGRLALHEWWGLDPGLRRLVQQRAPIDEIQRVAMGQGMRTLRQDGIEKVWCGLTSWAEVSATTVPGAPPV